MSDAAPLAGSSGNVPRSGASPSDTVRRVAKRYSPVRRQAIQSGSSLCDSLSRLGNTKRDNAESRLARRPRMFFCGNWPSFHRWHMVIVGVG